MNAYTNVSLEVLQARVADMGRSLNDFALIVFGSMVLLMQCGFAFLEAGSVRSKNTSNILIKNLLDSFVAGLTYWTIGYALAYGEGNEFVGWTKWASSGVDDLELALWYFQFVFAATAATIVSGALAERCEFVAYLVYSCVLTGVMYPIVTHWVWSEEGWLAQGQDYTIGGRTVNVRYKDFAGSGPVHVLGGVCAFFGAWIMGPRLGRFHEPSGHALPIRGHSVPFAALGGFILIFGFMAFNGGSQLAVSSRPDAEATSLAVTNSVLSASSAAFVSLMGHKLMYRDHTWSLLQTLNGSLAGMVAICAGCDVVRPWGAVCIGAIAGIVFKVISQLILRVKVDDPLDAVAVHLGGGSWGVVAVAFFHWDHGILFAWDQKSGYMLGWQLIGLASIVVWTGGLSACMFLALNWAGILRVSPELEKKGLDIYKHGEPAYPLESYGHGYKETIETVLDNGELGSVDVGFNNGVPSHPDGHFESPEVENMHHSYSSTNLMNGDVTKSPQTPPTAHLTRDDVSNARYNPSKNGLTNVAADISSLDESITEQINLSLP